MKTNLSNHSNHIMNINELISTTTSNKKNSHSQTSVRGTEFYFGL